MAVSDNLVMTFGGGYKLNTVLPVVKGWTTQNECIELLFIVMVAYAYFGRRSIPPVIEIFLVPLFVVGRSSYGAIFNYEDFSSNKDIAYYFPYSWKHIVNVMSIVSSTSSLIKKIQYFFLWMIVILMPSLKSSLFYFSYPRWMCLSSYRTVSLDYMTRQNFSYLRWGKVWVVVLILISLIFSFKASKL